ncbi:cupin domain-containing protein [Prauserella cavernicola]|uniref:Cupin domain-containing protein n=1 Tax=Prauserella cavernicola TaxID=2800127 RepID=A0A934R137_9PSEU|nr:cupin domain-containing protein [Prauserella cavernicola]MBK1789154.1 cupin domain-containing protein [Prauserella cavernicola]
MPTAPADPVLDRAPGEVRDIRCAHGGHGTTRYRRVAGTPGSPFYTVDWEFPAGTSEGPHDHRADGIGVEHYHVVGGTLVIVVDGVRHELGEGDALAIPRQPVREVRNESHHAARLLLVVERLKPVGQRS